MCQGRFPDGKGDTGSTQWDGAQKESGASFAPDSRFYVWIQERVCSDLFCSFFRFWAGCSSLRAWGSVREVFCSSFTDTHLFSMGSQGPEKGWRAYGPAAPMTYGNSMAQFGPGYTCYVPLGQNFAPGRSQAEKKIPSIAKLWYNGTNDKEGGGSPRPFSGKTPWRRQCL